MHALGAMSVTDNGSLVYNRIGNFSRSYAITGAGSVTKNGAGTQTLTNTGNSYGAGE